VGRPSPGTTTKPAYLIRLFMMLCRLTDDNPTLWITIIRGRGLAVSSPDAGYWGWNRYGLGWQETPLPRGYQSKHRRLVSEDGRQANSKDAVVGCARDLRGP
jgi:hypothetical protein